MAKKKLDKLSYEDMVKEIEKTILTLDDKELALDEALSSYKEGMELIEMCKASLNRVEKELTVIDNN